MTITPTIRVRRTAAAFIAAEEDRPGYDEAPKGYARNALSDCCW